MAIVRRFLIASSFARLLRKERGAVRVTEGYFPSQSGRQSHVHVEGTECQLVLALPGPSGAPIEERTDVPRGHADALLDVCAGKTVYDRVRLGIANGREALVDHVVTPGAMDLVSVAFAEESEANRFAPPPWFGPEVTGQDAFDNRAIALQGLPAGSEAPVSNMALEALLDTLENRLGTPRYAPSLRGTGEGGEVLDALRRLASSSKAEPTAEAKAPAASFANAEAQAETPLAETDSRIDDVIASLSKALGATDPGSTEEPAADAVEVDRWSTQARRSQA